MPKIEKKEEDVGLSVHLLVDESASMADIRSETVKAVNEYIKALNFVAMPATITVTKFGMGIRTIIDARPAYEVPQMTVRDYMPDGGTPTAAAVLGAIDALDKAPARQKAIVILTDGGAGDPYRFPDCQKEVRKRMKKGWFFLFLGTEGANETTAEWLGIPKSQYLYFKSSKIKKAMIIGALSTLSFQSGTSPDKVVAKISKEMK